MKRNIFLLTVLPLLATACITVQPVTNVPQNGTPTATTTLPLTQYSTETPASTDTPQTPTATALLAY